MAMNRWQQAIPKIAFLLLGLFVLLMALRSHSDTTTLLVITSLVMFAACWANATSLLGARTAGQLIAIAVCLGWFAEQMGSSRGWFFGSYRYTDVLGWRLGDVPVIIPMMWFVLCYTGYVLANLLLWRSPHGNLQKTPALLLTAFMAAALVTAYDLAADPYMVYVLKAWIMTETDGGWFGETLQGFVGWMEVSFTILVLFLWLLRKQGVPPPTRTTRVAKWDCLLPLAIYGFSMLFQAFNGQPIETRTIALFAMGLPLVCAIVAWWHWQLPASSLQEQIKASPVSSARLSQMRFVADPLADQTLAQVLKPWQPGNHAANLASIGQINAQFVQWASNQALADLATRYGNAPAVLGPAVPAALATYLNQGQVLPLWANPVQIARAEALFMDYGPISCTLLFCASLPECYVLPDLSAVLHSAGQLEQHTDYRIRATAAMIFPVMLKGGLTAPDGAGVAQILKVRLIHATIRNLILRGSPAQAMEALGDQRFVKGVSQIAAVSGVEKSASMYETLLALGWDVGQEGLPCNQEELAYTLLTFGYVFLRGMRDLDLGLSPADEEAYLHLWNVVGHVLGIRRELMPDTMEQAQALFAQIQARAETESVTPDPRPALGQALVLAMQNVIPWTWAKPVPVLLTRYLCGPATAGPIGVDSQVPWLTRCLFYTAMALLRGLDGLTRLFVPDFSFTRLFTRVLGYHLMSKVLLDQTRPLQLPAGLLNRVSETMGQWSEDGFAPAWMNRFEDKLTQTGSWSTSATPTAAESPN